MFLSCLLGVANQWPTVYDFGKRFPLKKAEAQCSKWNSTIVGCNASKLFMCKFI